MGARGGWHKRQRQAPGTPPPTQPGARQAAIGRGWAGGACALAAVAVGGGAGREARGVQGGVMLREVQGDEEPAAASPPAVAAEPAPAPGPSPSPGPASSGGGGARPQAAKRVLGEAGGAGLSVRGARLGVGPPRSGQGCGWGAHAGA